MRHLLPLLLLGCPEATDDPGTRDTRDDSAVTIAPLPSVALRGDGWLRGDLHVHSNHSDDARQQGGDDVAGVLAIADAWRDPVWTSARPELAEDGLDYVAITDHRTMAVRSDPTFRHDHLVLVGGEEFGSDGHAGIWGHQTHVPHEVQGDESPNQRLVDAIAEAHAQGGLFSINHPLYDGDLWGWDTPDFDAIEIWNGPWSTLAAETDEATLDAWVTGHGVENPVVRAAVRHTGGGQNAQALRFWQGWLSRGVHVPPVGGGDRHMVFPVGLPTTWVLAPTRDEAGILDGIAAGHTFVSRSPSGPQVMLEAEVDGQIFPMGSALPPATEVEVHWRVARASGGRLRLVSGVVDDTMPDPFVAAEVPLADALVEGTFSWTPPAAGGWLHAVVEDPLPADVPPEATAAFEGLTTFPESAGIVDLLLAVGPYLPTKILGDPLRCDPAAWEPWALQCMPVDTEPFATFYVPDAFQRLLHATFEDREPTGLAMGAVSAAFHTAPAD